MILPSRKLILLLLLPAIVLVAAPMRQVVYFALAYDVLLLALVLMDLRVSAAPTDLQMTRQLPPNLSLGADNHVGWEVHNASGADVSFQITDDVPEGIEPSGLPVAARIRARSRAELRYDVRPNRRGQYEFGDAHLRWQTRLGLAVRQRRIRMTTPVKVYPNVANLARYEMAAQRRRLAGLGLVATRQRGQGGIFESLREYVPGDDPVDMAWKATARRGRLITRNYEAERSQNILAVLDCGRLMTAQVDELFRLDHAINASLLLAYVAVKQGDHIGMLAFSDKIDRYMPPVKGQMALSRMKESLYHLEAKLCEPDYGQACRFLALRHRKRSLIVIFTDVIDAEASSVLLTYTARFARQHLPLCVTMRNLEVEAIAHRPARAARDCFNQAVALQLLDRRAKALAQMRCHGVDVLDVHPRALTPKLIERYLTLKQRRRI